MIMDFKTRVLVSNWNFTNDEKILQRVFHSCCMVENDIFMFGGIVRQNRLEQRTSSFVKYDIESGEYHNLTTRIAENDKKNLRRELEKQKVFTVNDTETNDSLPPLSHHTMNLVEQKNGKKSIYVFGGQKDTLKASKHLYKYSIEKKKWKKIRTKSQNSPPGMFGHTTNVVDIGDVPKLFVYGGTDGDSYFSSIFIFNTKRKTWMKIKVGRQWPSPRAGHTTIFFGTYLYIFGGGNDTKVFNDTYRYHIELQKFEKIKTGGTVKPTQRTYHCANVIGNRMIIIGGTGRGSKKDVISLNLEEHKWELHNFNKKKKKNSKNRGNDCNDTQDRNTIHELFGHFSIERNSKIWIIGGKRNEPDEFGQLYTLETNIHVNTPVSIGKSTLPIDLQMLVNDRATGDVILDLRDNFFYCHKSIFRIRCSILNKEYIKAQHLDSINLEELFIKLEKHHIRTKKMKKNFFADKVEMKDQKYLNKKSLLSVLLYIYGDNIPSMELLDETLLFQIGFIAKLLQLERLYLLILSNIPDKSTVESQVRTGVSVLPTTLFKDLYKLYHIAISYIKEKKQFDDDIKEQEKESNTNTMLQRGEDSEVDVEVVDSSECTEESESLSDFSLNNSSTMSGTSSTTALSTVSSGFTDYQSFYFSFCDVFLKVENELFGGHKAILMSRSSKFRKVLSANDFNGTYFMKGIRIPIFKIIFEFLYTDTVNIGFDVSLECLVASEEYELERLSLYCQKVIERKIHVHNVCKILNIADSYNIGHMKESCVIFIANHLSQVRKTFGYKRLQPEVKYLLKQKRKELRSMNLLNYQREQMERMKMDSMSGSGSGGGGGSGGGSGGFIEFNKKKYVRKRKSVKKTRQRKKKMKENKKGMKGKKRRVKKKKKRDNMKTYRKHKSGKKDNNDNNDNDNNEDEFDEDMIEEEEQKLYRKIII